MSKPRFIYFDVGGVLILDFSKTNKWQSMMDDLGVPPAQQAAFAQLFKHYEPQFCTGHNPSEFLEQARSQLNLAIPADYDLVADFVSRFTTNPSIHPLVEELSHSYRLGLLTAQYPGMLELLRQRQLLPPTSFAVVIDSSIERVTKPDPAIYALAQERAGVAASEILFIDNKSDLLVVPQQMGWQTFFYDPEFPEASTRALRAYISALA